MNTETIQFSKKELSELYDAASEAGKKIIESKVGDVENLKLKVEDRINSLEDACRENNYPLEDAIPFPNPKNDKQRCINAFAAKIEIVQALNEQKIPDWKNPRQYKYRNWYYLNGSSGSGLSLDDVTFDYSYSIVASRLCTLKEEHSKLIWDRFPEMEEALMTQKSN